jgi:hypothetical protein
MASTLAAERETAMNKKPTQKDAGAPIGDRLLTLREAAEVLRLSTRTVRAAVVRLRKDKQLGPNPSGLCGCGQKTKIVTKAIGDTVM